MVGNSSVLHSRQSSVEASAGGWGSSAPTSLPVGSLLVGPIYAAAAGYSEYN